MTLAAVCFHPFPVVLPAALKIGLYNGALQRNLAHIHITTLSINIHDFHSISSSRILYFSTSHLPSTMAGKIGHNTACAYS